MTPYRSSLQTAVPVSLEKRLEIVNAIRALAAQDESDQLGKRRADIAALRRDFEKLREEVLELWRRCEPRLRSYVIKFSPDQPRVSAGNPDGGQWTNEGESTSPSSPTIGSRLDSASRPAQYVALDTGIRTDATEAPSSPSQGGDPSAAPPVQLAADWRNMAVNLAEEEAPNGIGHTVRDHVGKSDAELLATLENERYWTVPATFIGIREGSFGSIENANDLVNRALRANSALVDLVASGQVDDDFLTLRVGSATGREAFRPDPDAEPYVRDTYSVGVEIWHDANSPRGFRVRTAYPMNE